MAHLQLTLAINSCLHRSNTFHQIVPLKIRKNVDFASTISSSKSAPLSLQLARATAIDCTSPEIMRPLENFSPHMWGDHFKALTLANSKDFESCSKQVEVLKEMAKDMLMTSTADPIENIHLINTLNRLGVSYHFESEIEEQLSHLFITLPDQLLDNKDYDLHTVAVIFQVFRSFGYKMSCDVFNKFKKSDGMFKDELFSDIKGMISLYEASHWGVHGKLILDEALAFTTSHLESLVSQDSCSDHFREYIANALNRPFHKGDPRIEARQYISFYEKDDSRNHILLKFAKYDFNLVQMHHQQELNLLLSWWEKSKFESRFPHVRQRPVEGFFIAVGVLFEPRFAFGRTALVKWYMALAVLDDTYDAYGFYHELQYLTKAIQRFDMSAMDELPSDYFKSVYEAFLEIADEVEEEARQRGRSFTVSYVVEEAKRLARYYNIAAQWAQEHIMPSFDQYIEHGIWSIGVIITMAPLMMGMEEADEEAFQWLIKCEAKIVRETCIISRMYNDLRSNEAEEKRGGQLSGITCYMKEYGVSKEEAIEGYNERIRALWKVLNEGLMERPMPVARRIIQAAFNIARVADICYKDDDGYTNPEKSYWRHITKVLIDPISLQA